MGNDSDDDVDSLFGSPPPSPGMARGRSLSLALPGTFDATDITKNVGTIALPGSHSSSETLVVNLPTSPPRQLAQVRPQPQIVAPVPPTSKVNRKRSIDVSNPPDSRPPKKAKPAKSTRASKTPVSQTTTSKGPSLTLPDPSQPLPPNLLRNQPGLLGVAGMVGRVHPAKLSTGRNSGSSPNNPIVVDEESSATAGAAWKAASKLRAKSVTLDPHAQAIVDSFMSHPKILPAMQSITSLLRTDSNTNVGCCTGANHHYHNTSHPSHPYQALNPTTRRKRKLTSVPAGAEDWDVPYPFPNNEGPENYREKWEKSKEREKRVMEKLTGLVRGAVYKAFKSMEQKSSSESSSSSEVPTASRSNFGTQSPKADIPHAKVRRVDHRKAPGQTDTTGELQHLWDFAAIDTGLLIGQIPQQRINGNFSPVPNSINPVFIPNLTSLGTIISGARSQSSPTLSNSPTLTSATRLSTPPDIGIRQFNVASREKGDLINQTVRLDSTESLVAFPLNAFGSTHDVLLDPKILGGPLLSDFDLSMTGVFPAGGVPCSGFTANQFILSSSSNVTSPSAIGYSHNAPVDPGFLDGSLLSNFETSMTNVLPAGGAPCSGFTTSHPNPCSSLTVPSDINDCNHGLPEVPKLFDESLMISFDSTVSNVFPAGGAPCSGPTDNQLNADHNSIPTTTSPSGLVDCNSDAYAITRCLDESVLDNFESTISNVLPDGGVPCGSTSNQSNPSNNPDVLPGPDLGGSISCS